MRSKLFALTLLAALGSFACSDPGGGRELLPADGGSGTGGSGGGGPACPETGKGEVVVEITGLPSDVDADVVVEGPDGTEPVTAGVTLTDIGAGSYTVTAERVFDADPIVRTVFDPTVADGDFCLSADGTQTVSVTYEPIPTSNKLWTDNANGDSAILGFASADLAESGAPAASVTIPPGPGKDITFDRDGNLWSMGGTVADAHLERFPAVDLGTPADEEPDVAIHIMDIPCLPDVQAMAFDADGALWVRTCGVQLVKIEAADLAASGDVTPAIIISGLADGGDLAFDADGNLWATNEGKILRFDASRLSASTDMAADLTITARDSGDTMDLGATALAFDTDGDLWAIDFGGNMALELAAADLAGTGAQTVVSSVSIAIGVLALLDRPAFDDGGGLWLGLGGQGIGRLAPAQLMTSSGAGDPTTPDTIITSADIGSSGRVTFFPAPVGLPLYHAIPAP